MAGEQEDWRCLSGCHRGSEQRRVDVVINITIFHSTQHKIIYFTHPERVTPLLETSVLFICFPRIDLGEIVLVANLSTLSLACT